MPPMTGRVVAGRYSLQHPIGRGAMGVVWRARDQLLDREVAVKEVVISALIGEDERRNAYQRTLREARTAARLSHRGVVAVYDVAEEDGRPWIIMELVPSRSLDQVLTTERRLTPVRTGRIGQQLLSALAAAHTAGVLHRDVKPSNVLIATERSGSGWDERAVLTDFGIAQFEGDSRLTQTGMVMGSPGFTAPERIRGGDATSASDLWSLGATLYAAAEGRGPYEQRGGAITTMSAIINEDAPVPEHAGSLGPVIAALMRREPSARPSAAHAARMFAQVLPQLIEVTERSHESTHPVTVRALPVPVAAPDPGPAQSALTGAPGPEKPAEEAGPPPATAQAQAVAGPDVTTQAEERAARQQEPRIDEPAMAAEVAEVLGAVGAVGAVGEAGHRTTAGEPPEADDPGDHGDAGSTTPEVTVLDAGPRSEADATVIDRGAAGQYQPTQLSLPVPRMAQGRPTFTASQPKDRAVPTFSAVRPDQAARADQGGGAPQAEPKATYAAAGPAQPGSYPGSTAPFAGPGGQYAGPSQPQVDLVSQYRPGSGGGRAQRHGRADRGGAGRWVILVLGAVVLAAAIGAGIALALGHHSGSSGGGSGAAGPTASGGSGASATSADPATGFGSVDALNHPSAAVPAGWTPAPVTGSSATAPAGFTIDVPPGWKEERQGLATSFVGPGGMILEVDLTPHKYQNMLTEARYVAGQAAPKFTGYQLLQIRPEPVRSTEGALWQFKRTSSGIMVTADDIFFIEPTPAGRQSYAVYIRAPSGQWGGTYLPAFEKILRTFQTLPVTR